MTSGTTNGTTTIRRWRSDDPNRARRHAAPGDEQALADQSRATFHLVDGFREVVTQFGDNLDAMLRAVVQLLPPVSRYPDACSARILLRGRTFATENWRDSPWSIRAPIQANGQLVGEVGLAYEEPRPADGDGPFTRGERMALGFAAVLLGKTAERFDALDQLHDTVRQLELERESLRQANATLHGILSRIDEERNTVRRTIAANVDKVLMPILRELESRAEPRLRGMVDLLRQSLEEISSPFVDQLSRMFAHLTPLEIGICRMVRNNLTTKEIARIRHVSPATVARQREHIRAKLGIARSNANLATYLRTFPMENGPAPAPPRIPESSAVRD